MLPKTMPMDKLADYMIKKSSIECEKLFYMLIFQHNEIAELYITSEQIDLAIDQYKVILDLIKTHEDKNLRVDAYQVIVYLYYFIILVFKLIFKLIFYQKMRTFYNLDVLLNKIKIADGEDIYVLNGIKNLKEEMEKLKNDDNRKHNVSLEYIII